MRPKTIICDIDGTLVEHNTKPFSLFNSHKHKLLPGVETKFNEWDSKGYYIILISGRKESMRKNTIQQLATLGIFYDQLIMGAGSGQRILINDMKPHKESPDNPTAISINLKRNVGLENIKI